MLNDSSDLLSVERSVWQVASFRGALGATFEEWQSFFQRQPQFLCHAQPVSKTPLRFRRVAVRKLRAGQRQQCVLDNC